jgi:hypothetical protein
MIRSIRIQPSPHAALSCENLYTMVYNSSGERRRSVSCGQMTPRVFKWCTLVARIVFWLEKDIMRRGLRRDMGQNRGAGKITNHSLPDVKPLSRSALVMSFTCSRSCPFQGLIPRHDRSQNQSHRRRCHQNHQFSNSCPVRPLLPRSRGYLWAQYCRRC